MSLPSQDEDDITRLLQVFPSGESDIADQLARAVYPHLHRIAANALRKEGQGHTLQTTALAHDAFLGLARQSGVKWQNRSHFYRLAAKFIRRILVDHARRRLAIKRQLPAGLEFQLSESNAIEPSTSDDRLSRIDSILNDLSQHDARAAQLIELRFFGGLPMVEAAEALEISLSTAKRDWRYAQAFLRSRIEAADD